MSSLTSSPSFPSAALTPTSSVHPHMRSLTKGSQYCVARTNSSRLAHEKHTHTARGSSVDVRVDVCVGVCVRVRACVGGWVGGWVGVPVWLSKSVSLGACACAGGECGRITENAGVYAHGTSNPLFLPFVLRSQPVPLRSRQRR